MGFLLVEKQYIINVSDVTKFAENIHAHGYGSGNADYVSTFKYAANNIKTREKCHTLAGRIEFRP